MYTNKYNQFHLLHPNLFEKKNNFQGKNIKQLLNPTLSSIFGIKIPKIL